MSKNASKIITSVDVDNMTLDELFNACGFKTPDGSDRETFTYSCSHPDNPDTCSENDGNCLASYCPVAYCLDDEEDEACPENDGDKRMQLKKQDA